MLASRRRSAAYEPIAAPVLRGDRYGGRPVYFSDVIVRNGVEAGSFADLKGASFAYNEPSSHSGYGIVRYTLVTMGETRGFFGRLVESTAHKESIALVARGEVDASAIDSQVLALELRDNPGLEHRIHVIDALGPSTVQPVVCVDSVPPEIREEVRSVFLGMGTDASSRAFLEDGLIERFVRAGPDSYDDIRSMVQACEDAHFLVLR